MSIVSHFRHTDRHPGMGVANPERDASTSISEPLRTRDEHDTTEPAGLSRRRFLRGALGAVGVVATGGGAAALIHELSKPSTDTASSPNDNAGAGGAAANPEATPTFLNQLTLNQLKQPENLDPPTWDEVFSSVAAQIEYDVNKGNVDDLGVRIPGTGMLPDQLQVRAAWIAGYRASSHDTIGNPNDPNDPRYYAWQFKMQLLQMEDPQPSISPQDERTIGAKARVRLTMGDAPSLVGGQVSPGRMNNVEDLHTWETEVELTRFTGKQVQGGDQRIPNIDGQQGSGWGIYNITAMYELPNHMKQDLPSGYPSVPPLRR